MKGFLGFSFLGGGLPALGRGEHTWNFDGDPEDRGFSADWRLYLFRFRNRNSCIAASMTHLKRKLYYWPAPTLRAGFRGAAHLGGKNGSIVCLVIYERDNEVVAKGYGFLSPKSSLEGFANICYIYIP